MDASTRKRLCSSNLCIACTTVRDNKYNMRLLTLSAAYYLGGSSTCVGLLEGIKGM